MVLSGLPFLVYWQTMLDGEVTARDGTMTFTTFVCFDLFNALSCRSQSKSVFSLGLTSNRAFLAAAGLSTAGQLAVIYLSPLQKVFRTEGLALRDLFAVATLSSSVFWLDEGRKFWLSRDDGAAGSVPKNSPSICSPSTWIYKLKRYFGLQRGRIASTTV